WQYLFWFFGHPEVYIMILPGFGVISEVLPVFSRKPIFGYRMIAYSSAAIGFLSFGVFVHHMFVAGIDPALQIFFMLSTMLIAVPTGVKIFSWLGTIWGGALRFRTAMLFAMAFIVIFTIGGISGIFLASVPVDVQLSDTYYVVAHIHYVLVKGRPAGDDPWEADTLEWATTSPPQPYNFARIPVVHSARPLKEDVAH